MGLSAIAVNGERCYGQRHKFRIGVDDREATEFSATPAEFHQQLCDALIAHGVAGRKTEGAPTRRYVFIEVWATPDAKWRGIQRRDSGNVIALYFDVVKYDETTMDLYRLACDSVQMARDIDQITNALVAEVTGI